MEGLFLNNYICHYIYTKKVHKNVNHDSTNYCIKPVASAMVIPMLSEYFPKVTAGATVFEIALINKISLKLTLIELT